MTTSIPLSHPVDHPTGQEPAEPLLSLPPALS